MKLTDAGIYAALLIGLGTVAYVSFHRPRPAPQPHHGSVTTIDGLPKPPPATAPLVQRERWVIEINTLYDAHPQQILNEWESLGEPPIYWSTTEQAYYFQVAPAAGQAVTLGYAQTVVDPPWYGKPLQP